MPQNGYLLCLPHRFAAFLLVVLFALPAVAQTPPANPLDFRLDLDTGGHTARISDLAFTPDGDKLVSSSDDKTIRVWDWKSGITLRTIRGFMGDGNDGKVFAIAISPDGRTLAAGGYFGPGIGAEPPYGDVRLFDLASGHLRAVLSGAEYEIHDLAFSPDGAMLATGGSDGFVYLWKKDDAAVEGWTAETRLDADSWRIEKVAFAANGLRLVAVTGDNGIRLWDLQAGGEIELPDDTEALRDVPVPALTVSQDGTLFAIGTEDGQVEIRSAADGSLAKSMPRQDFYIGTLVFADGGRRLVASCGYRCKDIYRTVVWDAVSGDTALTYQGHDGIVVASAANVGGTLVATAGGTGNSIQLWDPLTGERKTLLQGKGSPVTAVGLDMARGAVAWGNEDPCPQNVSCPQTMGSLDRELVLPAADRFFEDPAAAAPAETYRRAVQAEGQWALQAVEGRDGRLENAALEVSHEGKVVKTLENDAGNGYAHQAFTLIEKGLGLITGGTDGTLLEYRTSTGRLSGEFVGHTGAINAMVASERNNLLVTGSADQTVRLWNLRTHELIVSMFFAGPDWIVWMPQGYYYASGDGDKLIGWQVNQGRAREGRFIRAGQLKKYLWSPEMVRRAIILGSAEQAIKEMRPGVDRELQRLLERKPPEFSVKVAEDQSGVRDGYVAVEISGANEAGTDVSELSILSNSRKVDDVATRSVGGGKSTIIEVPVDGGENTIRITGTNAFDYLTERSITVIAKKREQALNKGKLYAVVIGVDKYPYLPDACSGRPCDLRYPVDDATEFLKVLRERSAPLFSSMESLVLVNRDGLEEDPKRAAALEAIGGVDAVLEPDSDTILDNVKGFLRKPGEGDTTIVFLAGHGVNIDEDYYFIPTDGRKEDPQTWKDSSLVEWSDIQKWVERTKGMRFMLLDTCHAANAFNPRLEKDAQDARIVVFSATAANNTAAELPELGHGVFTYSILEGMRGQAKTSNDGVTLFGLADYVGREVARLTASRQKPFYYVGGVENIVLAVP